MNEKGFTLIEVMVAMLIFSVLLAGMIPVFTANLRRNTEMEIRTGAIQAAQTVLDELRLEDPVSLPGSGTHGPDVVTVNGRDYEVTRSFCRSPEFCLTPSNRHISIEVAYRGRTRFSTETVYTRLR